QWTQTTPPAAPTWSCSRWGLPCRRRCRPRGALLPHHFTLAARLCRGAERAWRYVSVALSLGSPPPGVTRHRASVEPGLSSLRDANREERPSDRLAWDHMGWGAPASKRRRLIGSGTPHQCDKTLRRGGAVGATIGKIERRD